MNGIHARFCERDLNFFFLSVVLFCRCNAFVKELDDRLGEDSICGLFSCSYFKRYGTFIVFNILMYLPWGAGYRK